MRSLARLFRFLLQIQGAVVLGAKILRDEEAVEIQVRRHGSAKPRCPSCRRPLGGEIRQVVVRWRHLDLMQRRSYLSCRVREGYCSQHGRRLEAVPWAAPRAQHTHGFDRQVASLAQVADKSATARMFKICWRTVGGIVERVVGAHLPKDLLQGLEAIGVDETSYKRGHRYLTVVSCLYTGRVVWIGEGKSAETLSQFFEQLGPERSRKLQLVTMDMSEAYRKTVAHYAPQADIVYDRFHVVKLLLKAIDEIRREECRKLKGEEKKKLKGSRFALLRNPKHLKPKDEEVIRQVEASNSHLFRAYERRANFEDLWDCKSPDEAREFLMSWTRSALLSRLEPLRRFAKTVRDHIEGILGFFIYDGATNAVLEGTNNKIQLLIHRAFGFRRVEALMAMIMLCCSGIELT
jgi:transposase